MHACTPLHACKPQHARARPCTPQHACMHAPACMHASTRQCTPLHARACAGHVPGTFEHTDASLNAGSGFARRKRHSCYHTEGRRSPGPSPNDGQSFAAKDAGCDAGSKVSRGQVRWVKYGGVTRVGAPRKPFRPLVRRPQSRAGPTDPSPRFTFQPPKNGRPPQSPDFRILNLR